MATPSSSQLDDEGNMSDSMSGTEKANNSDSKNSRKRTRECLEDGFDDVAWDLTDDGRPKTRRVNPQRLAIRLGSDLVAEMEAHIVPGAKMPTFAVRKDFQERYSVDRRHIYDYFHSRGLRVAKEDKHTNLIRGRALKAQAQAQAQAIPKPKNTAMKEESPLCETLATRPFLAPAILPPKPRGRVPKKPIKSQGTRMMGRPPKIPKAKKTIPDFYVPPETPREDISSEVEAMLGPSSSGTETDWESSLHYPEFSAPCDTSDDNAGRTSDVSDFLTTPDDFVAGYFESPLQSQLSFLDDDINLVSPESHTTLDKDLLTETERTELYNLIDTNIPPALEQSVGTYQSYMDERSKSYFDHLLPGPRGSRRSSKPTTSATKTLNNDTGTPVDFRDVRKWLSDDLDLYQNCALNAYEFNPLRDDSERNNINSVTSHNGRGSPTGGAYCSEPLQSQSQNLPCLVEAQTEKSIPQFGKNSIKCENENPNPMISALF